MSILDVIRHQIAEHSRRSVSEGRAYEEHFLALLENLFMVSWEKVQQDINGLSDRLQTLETDTKALIDKVNAQPAPPSGPVVTQDQLDSVSAAVDSLGNRIDALKDQVVGATTPPAPAPAETPPTPPTDSNPPPPTDTPPST